MPPTGRLDVAALVLTLGLLTLALTILATFIYSDIYPDYLSRPLDPLKN
jgi:hypothetical protein